MRVLFTASNWPGHWFCMVPLGWALQAAGHEVRVACPPAQADGVTRAGLTPVPVLRSPDMMTMTRMMAYGEAVTGDRRLPGLPLHPFTGEPVARLDDFDFDTEGPRYWARCGEEIAASYDGAVAYARQWRPDLVCHDLMTPEGAAAAELVGATAVYHPPGLFGTRETEPGVDLGDGDPSGSFPRLGLAPWHNGRIRYALDTTPESALPPFGDTVRLPLRYVPYNGPGELPDWALRPGPRPRVAVLWGGSAVGSAGQVPVLHTAVRTALEAGAEVVLTTGREQVAALGGLPDGVRVLDRFPLHLLLETSTAIVHHGSVNCLMTAAAAGVPQLALPLNDEQIAVSRRLAGSGAVTALPALAAGVDEVATGVKRLLHDDGPRDAARRVYDEIAAQPSPAAVVATLEELAARH
ncbi:nucleotide disphospho-sugar-binding domain-containing protein [Micromonospora auratinigra]|uniref:UDP:flavonoid glycosyltransferase YjiC, YdhE family n=1 Tax=Micromonospora auratinigra TaxID=261654 RepID=A0A1A8ZFX5_9ACTN|nr:nucleotide disphospho-sugar-binding domain-containing protein [Micromonospora auratinigra]SBT42771.1 UDP:flavonoid glycosyltransferase YjiC, YdhE family [Micromonospora auratinigra]